MHDHDWTGQAARSGAALLVALAVLLGGAVPARTFAPSVADLLAAYAAHDPSVFDRLGQAGDLDAARTALDKLAPVFLQGASRKAGVVEDPKRRLLVTFALDLAGAQGLKQAAATGRLVEWACLYVRSHVPGDEFDRRWHLAATALLEGAVYPAVLDTHLDHAQAQSPSEPRFILARGVAAEQRTAPIDVLAHGPVSAADLMRYRDAAGQVPEAVGARALAALRAARDTAAVRAEASVRLAHLQMEIGDPTPALDLLDESALATSDLAVRYLGRLFRGRAFDALSRGAEARAAYQSALEIGPGAHAATMALAASLFKEGRRAEADRLVGTLLRDDDPGRDAWWSYWSGDYRMWPRLIASVREFLQ